MASIADAPANEDDQLSLLPQSRRSPTHGNFLGAFQQNGLQQKQREVPLDEAAASAAKSNSPTSATNVRYDGPAKAMGKGKYTADVQLPACFYCTYGRCDDPPWPHLSIDTSAAEKLPGVRAVYVIEHVYGVAELRGSQTGDSFTVSPLLLLCGQPIAGVAAVSQPIADDAAKLVKVQYDAMPFVVDRQRPAPTMLRLSFLARPMRLGVQAAVAVRQTSRRRAIFTGRAQKRRYRKGLCRSRCYCRERILYPGTDALRSRDPRLRC